MIKDVAGYEGRYSKDSQLNIIIRCPHIMTHTAVRGVNNE